MQIFFLTILVNLILGFLLTFSKKADELKIDFLSKKKFPLILGISAALIGLVNLFVVYDSKAVFFGDFIPSVGAIAGGAVFLLKYYMNNHSAEVAVINGLSNGLSNELSDEKTFASADEGSETDKKEKDKDKIEVKINGVKLPGIISKIFITETKFIGIYCLVAAGLHFLFPNALFF